VPYGPFGPYLGWTPHTSNDNPFSEAAFKTLKYRPNFPKRFGCIEDARIFGREFFTWYNESHRHSGVALMTPQAVHYGQAEGLQVIRGSTHSVIPWSLPSR
jgi:putative transposase